MLILNASSLALLKSSIQSVITFQPALIFMDPCALSFALTNDVADVVNRLNCILVSRFMLNLRAIRPENSVDIATTSTVISWIAPRVVGNMGASLDYSEWNVYDDELIADPKSEPDTIHVAIGAQTDSPLAESSTTGNSAVGSWKYGLHGNYADTVYLIVSSLLHFPRCMHDKQKLDITTSGARSHGWANILNAGELLELLNGRRCCPNTISQIGGRVRRPALHMYVS